MLSEMQTGSLDTFDPLDIEVKELEAGESHAAAAIGTIFIQPIFILTIVATGDDDDDDDKDKN